MRHLLLTLILATLLALQVVSAAPDQTDDHRWSGIERIVAIGDIHGDYDNYIKTLRQAGVINRRGRWSAGETHLVQVGDIPDRGPDTLRIIRHLSRLARQAERAGGRVHHLIGNHEAMNVYGDLRYVTSGEFEAFVTRESHRTRNRYFDAVMLHLRETEPERYDNLPDDYREQWEQDHPLGWVEHRMAWDPRWDPEGELFQWVMSSKVAVQINDLIFLHGGISAHYCQHDLASLTRMVHEALQLDDSADQGILEDETGPLWYRGLAGMEPATPPELVQAILDRYEANHMVIGHTPTSGVIWPRHDARVALIDVGMAPYYGGHIAWLEVRDGTLFAGYPQGLLELPLHDSGRLAYLDRVIEMQPGNTRIKQRRERLSSSAAPEEAREERQAPAADQAESVSAICGIGR